MANEDPIDPRVEEKLKHLGRVINDFVKPWGFVVVMFDTTQMQEEHPRMNYISNAEREDMVKMLGELHSKLKESVDGQTSERPTQH